MMSVSGGTAMSDFSMMIEEAKKEIMILLDNSDRLPWYTSISQLQMIIRELEKMNEVRDKNMFFRIIPKEQQIAGTQMMNWVINIEDIGFLYKDVNFSFVKS